MLRRIVDIVAVTAVIGLAGGLGWHAWDRYEHSRNLDQLPTELRRFEQMLVLQAASGQTQINSRGWPVSVAPDWFGPNPPRNLLVSPDRPWLEIATIHEATLRDPVIRMTIDRSIAAFWYNPYLGIVRARVPMQISDDQSLALYNAVNSTSLSSIHGDPLPLAAATEPARDETPSEAAAAEQQIAPEEVPAPDFEPASIVIETRPAGDHP
jgi:hypothetical protein